MDMNIQHVQKQSDGAAAPVAPPRKRAKKVHKQPTDTVRRRGKKKSLSKLTDMPLDVIFEVRASFEGAYMHLPNAGDIRRSSIICSQATS